MKKRLLTGTIILLIEAIFLWTVRYTPYAFDLFIGMLAIMGCVEIARTLERKKQLTNIIFIGAFPAILYIAMSLGIIGKRDWHYFILYFVVIIVALFLINFLYTIIFSKRTVVEKNKYNMTDVSNSKFALDKCMNSTFVMLYPTLLFSSFFVINHFFDFSFIDKTGLVDPNMIVLFFLVFTFAVTIMTDTFAMLVGSFFGGPKLCPLISPNKTISGAFGGLFFGTLGGVLTYFLFNLNTVFSGMMTFCDITYWHIILIGMIVSVVGQIGDILASALKRSARVKDYGTIFPGHGGVMDRVDGLIFNAFAVLISMFILF